MPKGVSFHPQLIEDALNRNLPSEFDGLIKPYHISKWEKSKPVFIGEEYYNKTQTRTFKAQYLKSLALIRLYRLRLELTKTNKKYIVIKGNENRILRQVKKSNRYFDLKFCCHILNLSPRRFLQIHKQQINRNCTPELYSKCNKRKPNQLTTEEVFTIKQILEDKKYLAMPITRLHSYACKNKLVSACYNSWLMVKNLFEIDRNHFRPFRMRNKLGIRANAPNELLHTDVSRFILSSNKKAYLFLMVDNCSRYIVNAVIAEKNNHQMNIVHFIKSIKNIEDHPNQLNSLMTDQGAENMAHSFIETVKRFGVSHIVAQSKSCHYSNSMIERMFASIKRFIRNKYENLCLSIDQLKHSVEEFIRIHNFEMPLYRINKTPHEIFWNIETDFDYQKVMTQTKQARIFRNSKIVCEC